MRLTVLQVSFPLATVGPDAVGGAEQVLHQLDRALVRAGHRSLVLAPVGSRPAGELVPLPPVGAVLDGASWARAHRAVRRRLAEVLARRSIDVVHLHGVDFDRYLPPPGPPALVTLHLPAEAYRPEALRPARPDTFLHCVSASQRRRLPPGVALLEDLENGVDLSRFRPGRRARGYTLALGRICAPKGTDRALDAAARAGVPLLLAGAVHPFPEHLRFFEEAVRPRLGPRARYLGPVGGARKRRLLAGARCVVVASRAAETCSLAALEALASGTPVVAAGTGALPDVIRDGVTGFLGETVEELAEGMRRAGSLDRAGCRREAEVRFPLERTLGRYLALYGELAGGGGGARSARGPGPSPGAATP